MHKCTFKKIKIVTSKITPKKIKIKYNIVVLETTKRKERKDDDSTFSQQEDDEGGEAPHPLRSLFLITRGRWQCEMEVFALCNKNMMFVGNVSPFLFYNMKIMMAKPFATIRWWRWEAPHLFLQQQEDDGGENNSFLFLE